MDVFVSGREDRGLAVYPSVERPNAAAASCGRNIEHGADTGTLNQLCSFGRRIGKLSGLECS